MKAFSLIDEYAEKSELVRRPDEPCLLRRVQLARDRSRLAMFHPQAM
jgi:hypothetical protein